MATMISRLLRFAVLCLTLCVSFAATAEAASPKLNNVLPHGGQRGTEIDVTLVGTNFADAQELMLYDAGLEVLSFEPPAAPPAPAEGARAGRGGRGGNRAGADQQLKVRLKIAPDCQLGAQRMRVRTATGLSDLQNFFVGALPIVEEKEPNTTFSTAQKLEWNVTVHGRIQNEDADYFSVQAKKGDRLSIEVFGTRLGTSTGDRYFDPSLTVFNRQQFEIAASDDTPSGKNDPGLSIIIPEDGEYTVQLRDSAFNGDDRAYYLMHVGHFPRPTVAFPMGGQPGETLSLQLLGDARGPITREITLPKDATEEWRMEFADEEGITPSPLPLRVVALPNLMESGENSLTLNCPAPGAWNGVIRQPREMDSFRFLAKKGEKFEIEVHSRRLSSPLDSAAALLQVTGGKFISNGDDNRGLDTLLTLTAAQDGEHQFDIRDLLNRGGPDFIYRVEIRPVEPSVTAIPVEFDQYVQPQLIVPRGGSIGVVVNVQKQNIGGAVTFASDQLPEGVTLQTPAGWENEGQIPILLTASPEAPVAGRYSRIETRLTEPKADAPRLIVPLTQNVLMVRGQNTNKVREEVIERLPVVVTDNPPFKLWIDPPKVPVVRGGTQDLVIHCERAEGFNGRIDLRLLKDPPGCSAIRSLKLDPDQTEVRVPFHANVDAPLKEWPIAMRGITRISGGAVEICTSFVTMKVEERYVDLEFAKAAGTQGNTLAYLVKVKQKRPFEGDAEIKLVGLPAKASVEPIKFNHETKEVLFQVQIAGDTPPGDNKNLNCEVRVPLDGEQILQTMGRGSLRIDPAPVAKPDAPPAKPAQQPAPLSRLDQLRQPTPSPAESK